MGRINLIFSLLFFMTFTIELFFGLFIMYSNPKGPVNRQFGILSMALCLWSFGFAMGTAAIDRESCLLWKRVAATGWTVVYALFLHLILLMTGKNGPFKKWHYVLLYLPAIWSLYVFSLSSSRATMQYQLIQTQYGWTNQAGNNAWDWFFYLYSIGYVLASLWLLRDWKRKIKERRIEKQANVLLFSIILMTLLGTITDLFLGGRLPWAFPQMAPVFHLIPLGAVVYSLKNKGYIQELVEQREEWILDQQSRSKLYFFLAILFILGGTISAFSYFLPHLFQSPRELKFTIHVSLFLYLIGGMILLCHWIKSEWVKGTCILGLTLLSIPVTAFQFLESSGITIWVLPMILMNFFLVFNSSIPLISVTAIGVATQLLMWVIQPSKTVFVDQFDFLSRIGVLLMTFGMGMVINQIYRGRLQENTHQIRIQRVISEISFNFLRANEQNIDEHINDLLKKVGHCFGVDRTYIFMICPQAKTMTYTHEWCKEGIDPEVGAIENTTLDAFPWWMEQLQRYGLVYIENVEELPEEATKEKAQLQSQQVKSAVVLPIKEEHKIVGFIGCHSVNFYKKWSDHHIDLLKTLANMLGSGLMKVRSEKEIQYMAYYDHLTALPNRTLFQDRLNQGIEMARRSGSSLAVMFIDLDNFKQVNDTIGHSGGDKLLQDVATTLTQILRSSDTVARFGGDEFLILLNHLTEPEEVDSIADKVMNVFRKPFAIGGYEFSTTASAGIALYPDDGEDGDSLIRNADMAMYDAKARGKNQYILFSPDLIPEVESKIKA